MNHIRHINEFFKKKEMIDIDIIRDILIDLEDLGLKYTINQNKDDIIITIDRENKIPNVYHYTDNFNINITKDCINRILEYIRQCNVDVVPTFSYRFTQQQVDTQSFPDENIQSFYLIVKITTKKKWWNR